MRAWLLAGLLLVAGLARAGQLSGSIGPTYRPQQIPPWTERVPAHSYALLRGLRGVAVVALPPRADDDAPVVSRRAIEETAQEVLTRAGIECFTFVQADALAGGARLILGVTAMEGKGSRDSFYRIDTYFMENVRLARAPDVLVEGALTYQVPHVSGTCRDNLSARILDETRGVVARFCEAYRLANPAGSDRK